MPDRRRFTPSEILSERFARSTLAQPLLEMISKDKADLEELHLNVKSRPHPLAKVVFLDDPSGDGGVAAKKELMAVLREMCSADPSMPMPRIRNLNNAAVSLYPISYLDLDKLLNWPSDRSSPIRHTWPRLHNVIIDLNLKYVSGVIPPDVASASPITTDSRERAKLVIENLVLQVITAFSTASGPDKGYLKPRFSSQYVFARLDYRMLELLVTLDRKAADDQCRLINSNAPSLLPSNVAPASQIAKFRAIHTIWPDFEVQTCVHRSMRTVKADAAQNSFSAYGEGITWAVLDTGIDADHPHFKLHKNIVHDDTMSFDFTQDNAEGTPNTALTDENGHGTHVAGIIAGMQQRRAVDVTIDSRTPPKAPGDDESYPEFARMVAASKQLKEVGVDDRVKSEPAYEALAVIAGIAPKCKLVSMRVLNDRGAGLASDIIRALEHIQKLNNHGRDLKIHGVNLSVGHGFQADWFACGYSPLCVEVNRLVKSGVVVVVAAGNSGYGAINAEGSDAPLMGGLDMSINDPGNAELALTVGSTHRDQPHRYGVSYFSSKGPTGDGRNKPDLLAPGERIVSAAAWHSKLAKEFSDGVQQNFSYMELSGTSQAAPHASGAIAALMSIRAEFIGEPERIKQIFTSTATDVGRDRSFQGAGVLDLLRAIQSI